MKVLVLMAPFLVLFILLALCQPGSPSSEWTSWNEFAYKVSLVGKIYFHAAGECQQENADIASICSKQEEQKIIQIIKKFNYSDMIQIGYFCNTECNKMENWVWEDRKGCNYTQMSWAAGHPVKEGRRVVVLNLTSNDQLEWISEKRDTQRPFICKRGPRSSPGKSTLRTVAVTGIGTTHVVVTTFGPKGGQSDVDFAVDKRYLDILNKIEAILPGNKNSLENTEDISEELRNIIRVDMAPDTGLTPGNLNASLQAVLAMSRLDLHGAGVDPAIIQETLINIAFSADHLLSSRNTGSWHKILLRNKHAAVKLVNATDNIGSGIASTLALGSTKNISLENFAIQAMSLPKNPTKAVYLDVEASEGPPVWHLNYSSTESSTALDSILVQPETLKVLARNSGTNNLVMWATYHMTLDRLMSTTRDMTINSRIRALTAKDLESGHTFHPPITLRFRQLNNTFSDEIHCSFWKYSSASSGYWSQEGCLLKTTHANHTTCECNHLTNFAILVSPYIAEGIHARILTYISVIGCIMSILGCFATIVSYALAWKEAKSQHAIVYLNLCAVLMIANLLFLVGIDKVKYDLLCTVVAALLHYFWLVAFMVMLADGVMFILNVVYVFHVKRLRETILLLVIAWFVPAVVVGVTFSVTGRKSYGTEEYCWLERGGILNTAFVAPVAVIIVANIAVLVKVLHTAATSKFKGVREKNTCATSKFDEQRSRMRAVIWNIMVILPLLGVAWIFGLLSVNQGTVIFQYVFAMANSLQGFFIFIFYCALNEKVHRGVRVSIQSMLHKLRYDQEILDLKHSTATTQIAFSKEGKGPQTNVCLN